MNPSCWHVRLGTLALLVSVGFFAAQRSVADQRIALRQQISADTGKKIAFSEPVDPFAEKKVVQPKAPKSASEMMDFSSPVSDFNISVPSAPPVQGPKKDKKNDWLSDPLADKDSADGDKTLSPNSPSGTLTHAWYKEDRDKEKLGDSNRTSEDSPRKANSRSDWLSREESDKKNRSDERGWMSLRSALENSPFGKTRDNPKDQDNDSFRQGDRQSRMDEFRALYNASGSTSPLSASSSANQIHESLWRSTGDRKPYGEAPRPSQSSPMPSGLGGRIPGLDPVAVPQTQAQTRGRAFPSDQKSDGRYEAPAILEMPRPPGSLMR